MTKIVVLDDVRDGAVLVQRILEKSDRQIEVFTEEEELLSYARATRIDLAILDIKLKKMGGVEVLEQLKHIDPRIRVIMLTGYPTLETARDALRLGAAEYLVKPLDNDELEIKVAAVLSAPPE